ncbi:hypothetical protein F4810DRAFT_707699 [Camillea tinctor]|nr:hypothetical protein F4810DRAFT_707699 [Camillea tinctor]
MKSTSMTVPASTYETVQKWIGRQLESNTAVTEAQRELLVNLEHSINPPPPPRAEPELDSVNWIEYRAALRMPTGGSAVVFTESQVDPHSVGPSNWLAQVTIDEHPSPFPGPSGGLFEDGTQPSFARKKDAKKYAAKCAIEWLRANQYMPQDGVKFPKVKQAAPQPVQKSTQKSKSQSSPPRNNQPNSPKANKSPKTPVPVSPFDDTEPSAVVKVTELCGRLGFRMKYVIDQVSPNSEFFNGYPDFGIYAAQFPDDIGCVKNILGRKAAKEKIAEELLEVLEKIEDERRERDRKFMSGELSAGTPL